MKNNILFKSEKINLLRRLVLFLVLVVLTFFGAKAQDAAFTFTLNNQCGSGTANFNQTSVVGVTSWVWDFGNGNSLSTTDATAGQNPSATYPSPGVYTVSLAVNGGAPVTKEITIYPNPEPNFTVSAASGCEPMDVTLSGFGEDVSVASFIVDGKVVAGVAGGAIESYQWSFLGKIDGVTKNVPELSLSGLTADTYGVLLVLTDEHTCTASTYKPAVVTVNPTPAVDFSITKENSCGTGNVTFDGLATISSGQISEYQWDIDNDGSIEAVSESYTHSFASEGTFNVALTLKSDQGCLSTEIVKQVQFNGSNTTNFSFSGSCVGQTVNFTDESSASAIAWSWDFGDGTTSSLQNPTKTFSSTGDQTVRLTATHSDGCVMEVTKTVSLSSASASFTYSLSSMCAPEYEETFTNTSTTSTGTITSYSWDFNGDDVEDSNVANPTYSFNSPGIYSVKLTVTSSEGCESTYSENIIINEKTLDFTIDSPSKGCEGLIVGFDGTYSDAANDPVAEWNWVFGDGTGTGQNPSHTYNTRGEYDVSLSVVTTNGCTLTKTKTNAVQVGQKPVITQITPPDGDCANVGLGFVADFTGLADSLVWGFSNGGTQISKFADGASPQSILHEFKDDSDSHSLTVVAFDNGCPSDFKTISNIEIKQPIANFSASQTVICSVPFTVNFSNTSESDDTGTTYEWDFDGDGIVDSGLKNPSFEYTVAGDYTVSLTVTNPSTLCSDVKTLNLFVTTSSPDFSTDYTVACHPAEIGFTNQILANSSANFSIASVDWNFGDGLSSVVENPTHTYIDPSSYGVTMIVTEQRGCSYTVTKDNLLSINGPVASFTESPVEACLGDEITFTNTTTKYSGDPALEANNTYLWNFGDGFTSEDENTTHTYGSENIFEVSLLVTDDQGCKNNVTESNSVIVPNLVAGFTTSRDIYCLGDNVEFTNTASITNGIASITNYDWDLDGNGSYEINATTNADQSLIFASTGTYTVSQRITSSLGCTNEFTKNITIVDGDGTFTPDDTNLGCAPTSTTFRANDDNTMVASYAWNFGDGGTSADRDPLHFYVYPGSYEVTLTVLLTGGCTKTSTQTITVAGAVGNFSYDNLAGCANPDHIVKFEVSEMSSVSSLTWDFGIGATEKVEFTAPTTSTFVDHAYTNKGTKRPFLTLTDETCGDYAYFRDDLGRINTSTPPTVDFSKSSGANICENVEFQFSDLSVLTDDRYQIVSWSWDFDEDGVEDSNLKNPKFTYTTAGNYDVSLTVTSDFGCTASLTKTDFITVVSPDNLKDLDITITEPGIVNAKFCSSDNVTFNGSATSTNGDGSISAWAWDFGDGNDASVQNALHTYSTSDEGLTKTVTLTVTDNSQCVQMITKDVSIYKVDADFSMTSTPVLRGNNIAFADLSTTEINSVSDGTIDTWAWTFEEGTPTSSAIQNPSIAYNTIGNNYDVDLTVTNNEGCTDNASKTVSVLNNPPVVSNFGVSGNEDIDIAITQADFNSNFDTSLDPSQAIVKVEITSLPANGDLYIGATIISALGTELTYAELANLKFVPDENWNGSTSFDYNVYDGYDYAVADASITITVDQVQDVPVVANINLSNDKDVNTSFDIATFEDKFSDVDLTGNDNPDFQKIKITELPDPLEGILKLNNIPVTPDQEIEKESLTNLVFEPLLGFVGTANFGWNGSDDADYANTAASVNIEYINTKPQLTSVDLGDKKEDVVMTFAMSFFLDYHVDPDVNDDPFTSLKITSLPSSSAGVFRLNGTVPVNLTVGLEIPYEELLELEFTPSAGFNGTVTMGWDIFDGTEYSEAPATISFTYVNTRPTVSDITMAAVDEDTQVNFVAADFSTEPIPFSDEDASDDLTRIRIKSLPSNGTLKLNGSNVSDEQYINLADLANLEYFPDEHFNGTDSFNWKGNDGTTNSSNVATVNLTINPIQDKPTVSNITKLEIEDTPVPILAQDFIDEFSDVDAPYGNPNSTLTEITILSLPSNGTLEYNGSAIVLGTNNVIAITDIDNGTGLVFTADSGYEGVSSFDWNGSDGLNYADDPATVTITHSNTPPEVANHNFGDKLEDLVFTITRADFETYYSDDDATDQQFDHVEIISLPSSAIGGFTIKMAGIDVALTTGIYSYSDLLSGLKFTPAEGVNGTANLEWNAEDGTVYAASNATFSFTYINSVPTVSDFSKPAVDEDNNIVFAQTDFDSNYSDVDANDSTEKIKITNLPVNGTLKYGTTILGSGDEIAYADLANLIFQPNENWYGTDSFTWIGYDGTVYSSESTVSLTVNSVNDIPTAADESVTELEDVTYTFASSNFSNSYADVETVFSGIEITGLESAGSLEYDGSPVTLGLQVATADISKLKFIPSTDENGSNYDAFTFKVYDGEDYSTEVYTMTVNITPVNDEPSFSLKTDPHITVEEDSGAKIVNGQAISISKGAANELVQNLTFDLTNNNNSLFSSQPIMDASGNLNFTLADNAFGTATITVILNDDGGTANSGDDTSSSETFTITINSVNDHPLADNESVTILEDQIHTFTGAEFSDSYADVENSIFAGIRITELESIGDLKYEGVDVTNNQVIALADIAKLTFTPQANENGTSYDSFKFEVYDGTDYSDIDYTMTVNVTPVNDEPLFTLKSPKDIEVDEDNGTEVAVGQVTTQSEGPLNESSQDLTLHVSHTNSGLFSVDPAINAVGTLTFTPTPNAFGTSTVTVYITDDGGTDDGGDDTSDSQTFTISVISVNDAPVADNDSGTVDEGQIVTISLIDGDSDVDGTLNLSSITIVSGPLNGSIVDNGDGTITYTHDGSETSSDNFTYTIQDNNSAESNVATVSIVVTEVNDTPIALDNNAVTKEDEVLVINVLANDSDVDGTLDLTSLKIVSGQEPAHGTVSINPTTGEITYTPNTDYHGNDEFTYEICDDDGACTTAVVYVVVQSENDTLVANNDTAETDEDTLVNISVLTNDVDSDGTIDPGSLVIVGQASNGTLVVDNVTGIVSYTPNENFQGTDSFTYEVCDDQGACDFATVTITVNDVNDTPIALDNNAVTKEDEALVINVLANDSDVDGTLDLTSLKIVAAPMNGTVSINPTTGEITYTPDADYHGNDEFTYEICDDDGACTTAVVYVVVQSENDTLVANNDTAETDEDTPVDISVLTNDVDLDGTIDPESIVIVGQAANGTLIINNITGVVSYTPNDNFHGVDSFTYEVCDDQGACDFATVTITVNDVNDMPIVLDNNAVTKEDEALVIDVLANDSDVDGTLDLTSLKIVAGEEPTNGTVSINPTTGEITYTPDADYHGNDEFTYEICDDDGACTTAVVYLVVQSENDTLVANNDTAETDEDTSVDISVLTNDVDLDGTIDPESIVIVGQAANGILVVDNVTGIVSYTPDENFHGVDSFTYEVCDDQGACDFATVTITVNDVNDTPIALDNNVITNEDVPVMIDVLANDSDVDGMLDLTSLKIVSGQEPAHGTVSINPTTGEITYTPDADYYGNDEFTYEICDDDGACTTAVVYVVVQSENDTLVANNDTAETDEDTPVNIEVLTNDVDLDGTIDPGSLVIVGQASNGTLVVNNITGVVSYTPNDNFHGVDSFTYEVCDDQGACDFATVTITVNDINDMPIALDNNAVTKEDVPVVINVLANDSDVDGTLDLTSLKIVSGQEPAHGTVSINPTTGEITYTPDADYHGNDEFTYEICDDDGACTTAVVYVVVQSENDTLVANNDTAETDEDTPVNISVLTNDEDSDGIIDPGSLVIVGQASNGILIINNITGVVSYTPNDNFHGVDSFTYEVCDDQGACDFATVGITVNDVNDVPVALDNNAVTDEDVPVVINVLANDSDVDGTLDLTSLKIVSGQEPAHGTVSINPTTGEITYTPDADYHGNDEFIYEICDDDGDCDTAVVYVVVQSENDTLVANNDTAETDEDTPVNISVLTNDVDLDGTIDPGSLVIVGQASNGTLVVDNVTGIVSYTPNENFHGVDSFTYEVCDDQGACDFATVTITVNDVNDMPIVLDNNAVTKEDEALVIDVLANDSDVDGTLDLTSLKIVAGEEPTNGTVSINPTTGEITYTPDADYHGNDEFTYEICDDDGACTTAVVYVVVQSENDTLVANNDTAETDEDTPVDISVLTNDVDLDGTIDPESIVIVGQAANGTLIINNITGIVSYTPNEDFHGVDSFTYEVCDDQGACDFATVSITVNDVNDVPVALDNNAITDEDVPVVINVLANDSDVDGTLVLTSLQVVSGPSNGTVSINPTTGEITYTPDADYHGNDEFTYEICDDDGACTTAVVYVVVQSENDTLVANNDTAETDEDTPVDISVLTNDVDLDGTIDPESIVIVGQAANGTLIINNITGVVSYTPNDNFHGVDSFTYEVCDDQGACDFATVTITVNDVNDTPIALDNNAVTKEDEALVINVLANDSDVDGTLDLTSLQVVSGPANGTVSINPTTGEITYTPNADYHGNDEFTYEICDDDGACTTAVVYVVVQSENDTLVANNDTAETDEDTLVNISVLTNDVDSDGTIDPGSLVIVGQASNGTLVVDNVTGIVSYTPDENFHGVDSFTYEVCDDQGACDFATVSIAITEVNDSPVALDNNAITKEDEALVINVLANDSDVDGTLDLTSLQVVSGPSNGTVSINPTTGEITYTPDADYHGNDEFTYEICDDDGACTTAVVYVVVQSENDTLVANNDTAETDEDTPVDISVLTNDVDLDGTIDPESIVIVGQAANGTLIINNITGVVSYTPNDNFHGVDSFTYEVCDDQGACDFATVTITVNDVNDMPIVLDNNAVTKEDEALVIDVLANDSDVDGTLDLTSLKIVAGEEPTNGTVSINPTTGEITYTPDADYHGNDEFTYEICDDDGACTTAVVYVVVQSENDTLVANNDTAETDEDTSVDISVLTNDVDLDGTIDPESIVIVGQAANGTLIINNITGVVSYTPNENFHGVDSFTYEVCDDQGACDFATVTVTVNDVNDTPIALDNNAVTNEDVPVMIDVLANDSDVDGTLDLTSLKIVTGQEPAHGTISINPTTGEITYTPDTDYHGNDEFTYEICDDDGACTTAVVYVVVQSENDTLVANNDTAETDEDTPVNIPVLTNDVDSDGTIDPGSLVIVGQASNGILVVDNVTGIVSYTPDENFHGVDSFTYEVCDDQGACDFATVTVTVNDVNDTPIALDNNVITNEDVPVMIDVLANDSDIDGILDLTSLQVVSGPSNGTVSINPTTGEITYTPDADYHGNDEFTYEICDDDGACTTAVVYVVVQSENDTLVANNDTAETDEDTPVDISVLTNDVDLDGTIDPRSIVVVGQASNGTLVVNNITGVVSYTPNDNFHGVDSFTYEVCDDQGACDFATVTITVNDINDMPIALDNNAVTKEDEALVIDVLANDSDVDGTLDLTSLKVVTSPTNGTVSINPTTGEITYTPDADYHGNDEFTYEICDDDGACTTAVVYVVVQSENDTLVANNDTAETDEDTPVNISVLTNDEDSDGIIDPGSLVIVGQASNGTLVVDNVTGIVSYTPNENFQGTDSFTYEVCDDQGACDFATVSITVNDVNDVPTALDNNAITDEDVPVVINVLANDSDVDGTLDLTSLKIVAAPMNGTVSINPTTGEITYTPNADYHGNDEFTYEICDDDGACTTAVVYVVVQSENDTLVANNDTAETDEDTLVNISVLTNDVDSDGTIDPGSLVIVGQAANGTLVVDNVTGIVSYTPDENFHGVDSFTYEVCDDQGACDFATVSITVNDVNDAPTALDNNAVTNEDVSVVINVLANDSDVDGTLDLTSLKIVAGQEPTNGTIGINPTTGEITYTPNADYHGNDQFTYEICDDDGDCATAVVYIEVVEVNDHMNAVDDTDTTEEDSPVTTQVLLNDTDIEGSIDPTSLSIYSSPSHGTVVVNTDGTITYTPESGFNGVDTYEYQVCDDGGFCDIATVSITVSSIDDDVPVALDDAYVTPEDVAIFMDILANDSDLDNDLDPTTVSIITDPSHGVVTVDPVTGQLYYIPNPNYHGTDEIQYQVCDKQGHCTTAKVSIIVNEQYDLPVANEDEVTTPEDVAIEIEVLVNDWDVDHNIDLSTLEIVNQPKNGSVTIDPGTGIITYTPNEGFNGLDLFSYNICDNNNHCDQATVSVIVTPVNDPPVAVDDYIETLDNTETTIRVLINDEDPDGDDLIVSIVEGPSHGTLKVESDGSLTYKADLGYYCNTDSFVYSICDPYGLCDTAEVMITIDPLDSDSDRIPDAIEGLWIDQDSDGMPNFMDTDSDNDGISDLVESQIVDSCFDLPVDTDGDSIPDYLDVDSDNDGYSDEEEGDDDCDNDGLVNYLDAYDDCSEYVDAPEGFSPNGDGVNDFFVIKGIKDFPNSVLRIFNRWGAKIYSKKGYQNDWDGRADNSMTVGSDVIPEGTYYYVIDLGDGSKAIKGFIYINY